MKDSSRSATSMDAGAESSFEVDGYSEGIAGLVELGQLKSLFVRFSKLTGLAVGLLDGSGTELLLSAGWKNTNAHFYSRARDSEARCIRVNRKLLNALNAAAYPVHEVCGNGVADFVMPITIAGRRLAILIAGQVLLQPPDQERLRARAKQFGFDESDYVAAVSAMPVVDESELQEAAGFLQELAQLIAEMGQAKLRLNHEIARHQTAECILKEKESHFRRLYGSLSDAVGETDLEGNLVGWNRAFQDLLGYAPEELSRLTSRDLTPEKWLALEARISDEQVLPHGCSEVYEKEYRCKDGTILPVELQTFLLRDEIGRPEGMRAVVRDISARKRRVEALQPSHGRLALARTAARAGAWDWNIETDEILWTDELFRLFGLDPAAARAGFETWRSVVHPADLAEAEKRITEAARARGPLFNSYRIVLPSGESRWIEAYGNTFSDTEGRARRMVGLCTDGTRRHEAEPILQHRRDELADQIATRRREPAESESRFRALVAASSNVVYCMGPDWSEMRHIVGDCRTVDVLHPDRAWLERFIPADDQPKVLAKIAEAIAARRILELEHRMIRQDGTIGWTVSRAIPRFDAQGQITEWFGMSTDVTDRKQAALELQTTRDTLAEAQRIAHLGSFEYIAATRTTVWSAEEFRIFGLDPAGPSPAYDMMLAKCIHPDDTALLHAVFTHAMDTNSNFELEHRIVRPDGSTRWVHNRAQPYFGDRGELVRYIGTTLDITDRKLAEEAVRAADARFGAMANAAAALIWETDTTGAVFVNQHFLDYCGVDFSVLRGMGWARFLHPDDAADYIASYQRAFECEEQFKCECRFRRADGQYRWLLSTARPLGAQRYVGICVDITERKDAEIELRKVQAALEESDARFCLAMEAADEGIWDWRMDSGHVYYSPGYAKMLGYEVSDLESNVDTWIGLLHPDEADGVVHDARRLLGEPGHYALEFRLRRRDGSYLWVLSRGKVVEWCADGTPKRAIGTHVDISELKEARMTAERLNRAKSAFLANMSHEIRTPLNAIVGLTHALLRGPMSVSHADAMRKIAGAAEHLTDVINDILDISKIEADKVDLEHADFDLEHMLTGIGVMIGERLRDKPGVELVFDTEPQGFVNGDVTRLRQALLNLLGNAVKFTERGTITFRSRAAETGASDVLMRFEVEDTGVGVAAHDLPRLFTAFEQADSSTTRRYGGTGLGLAITRRLAALMGGETGATSTPGQGSRFWMTARLGRRLPSGRSYVIPALEGRRALIIDDVPARQAAHVQIARMVGLEPAAAADGTAAISMIELADQAGEPFAVVLTDSGMHGSHADEILARLRTGTLKRQPLMVMVTARMDANVMEAAGASGVAEVLATPLSATQLNDCLVRHCDAVLGVGGGVPGEPSATPNASADTLRELRERYRGTRLLLAEDDPINQDVAVLMLDDTGWQVDAVDDGRRVVDAVRAQRYDVILMDMQMPVMDGLDATRRIRELPNGRDVPVIAMTANAFAEDKARCLAAGMDDFVSKPVDPERLYERLLHWRSNSRAK